MDKEQARKLYELADRLSKLDVNTLSEEQLAERSAMIARLQEVKQRLDPKCWDGYKKQGTKMKGDTRVNNCVPESIEEANGEYDDEAGMAQSNLHTMARAVNGLLDTIEDNDNLPEWAQEKIAKAEMMVTSVWDYLLSQKEQGIDPKVEEGWKDIVGGAVGGGIGGALAASPAEMIPGIPWGVPALAGTALGAALGAWRAKALDKPVYQVYVNGKKASDVIGGNDAVRLIGKLASKEHDTKTTFTIMNVKSDRIVFRQVWSTNSNDTGGDPGWVGNWSGKESKEQGVDPKVEGVVEGSDNITAVFSGYGNYMKGRGANVFKHYGITVLDKQYDEDEDIAEYTVSGNKAALDQARAYLERSDQFGGMILKQGVAEAKKPSPKLTPVNIKKSDPVSEEINTEAYERLQKVFAFKNYES